MKKYLFSLWMIWFIVSVIIFVGGIIALSLLGTDWYYADYWIWILLNMIVCFAVGICDDV